MSPNNFKQFQQLLVQQRVRDISTEYAARVRARAAQKSTYPGDEPTAEDLARRARCSALLRTRP